MSAAIDAERSSLSIAFEKSSCTKTERIVLSVPKSLKMRQPNELYVISPETVSATISEPCPAATIVTKRSLATPALSLTSVLTKLSRSSLRKLVTTTYIVTPHMKSVIASTHISSTVFSVRRQSTPIEPIVSASAKRQPA